MFGMAHFAPALNSCPVYGLDQNPDHVFLIALPGNFLVYRERDESGARTGLVAHTSEGSADEFATDAGLEIYYVAEASFDDARDIAALQSQLDDTCDSLLIYDQGSEPARVIYVR